MKPPIDASDPKVAIVVNPSVVGGASHTKFGAYASIDLTL